MKALLFLTTSLLTTFAMARGGHSRTPSHDFDLAFRNGDLVAHVQWINGPLAGDECLLKVDWENTIDGTHVDPNATFSVDLWMPDMGHGSARTHVEPALDTNGDPIVGSFDVSNVFFIMGGVWEMNFSLTDSDENVETQTVTVEIEGSGHHH